MNDYFTTIGSKLANKIKNKFKPTPFEETDELISGFQSGTLKKLKPKP